MKKSGATLIAATSMAFGAAAFAGEPAELTNEDVKEYLDREYVAEISATGEKIELGETDSFIMKSGDDSSKCVIVDRGEDAEGRRYECKSNLDLYENKPKAPAAR